MILRTIKHIACAMVIFSIFSTHAQEAATGAACIPPCRSGYTCLNGVCVESCSPPCRSGYVCLNGQCVERCNPPCPPGEKCDASGNCVRKQPSGAAPQTGGAVNAADTIPSRAKYKNSFTGEIPWNGLVGLGMLYTYRPISAVALEGGFGFGMLGLKYGVRGRLCFSPKTVSPFLGLGFISDPLGADDVETEVGNTTVEYDMKPISFLQITGGLDIVTKYGFTMLLGTGWAVPLNEGVRNVTYDGMSETEYRNSAGSDPDNIRAFEKVSDILFKGGIVVTIGAGVSF